MGISSVVDARSFSFFSFLKKLKYFEDYVHIKNVDFGQYYNVPLMKLYLKCCIKNYDNTIVRYGRTQFSIGI